MAFDFGLNFRSTDTYVTDGAGETYVLADAYPTTRGGVTFGWLDAANKLNRDSGLDRRLAGINWVGSTGFEFQVDLPASGDVDVYGAFGDPVGGGVESRWLLVDNTTTFQTLTAGFPNWKDATNAALSSAAWPGSNAPVARTFGSTTFILRSNNAAEGVAHLRFVQEDAPGGLSIPIAMYHYRHHIGA